MLKQQCTFLKTEYVSIKKCNDMCFGHYKSFNFNKCQLKNSMSIFKYIDSTFINQKLMKFFLYLFISKNKVSIV